jgi:hypothetical protein
LTSQRGSKSGAVACDEGEIPTLIARMNVLLLCHGGSVANEFSENRD